MQRYTGNCNGKGQSIYDVHTEGGGDSGTGGRMWTGVGRGQAPCGHPHRKLKLKFTYLRHPVFFSCKEVGVSIFTRISSLDGIKSGNFSAIQISNIDY